MPIVDKKPSDRPDLTAPAALVAAREVTEIEAAFVAPGGDERATPVALLRLSTASGREVYRFSPLALVLVVQDLNDLLASRGGMVAVLRQALNTPDTTSPVDALRAAGVQMGPTVDVRGMTPEEAAAAVAAAAPAFEGAER